MVFAWPGMVLVDIVTESPCVAQDLAGAISVVCQWVLAWPFGDRWVLVWPIEWSLHDQSSRGLLCVATPVNRVWGDSGRMVLVWPWRQMGPCVAHRMALCGQSSGDSQCSRLSVGSLCGP